VDEDEVETFAPRPTPGGARTPPASEDVEDDADERGSPGGWEEHVPEPESAPVVNRNRVAPERPVSFGRGRRRDAAARSAPDGMPPAGSRPAPDGAGLPAEDRRVDVFAAPSTSSSEPAPPVGAPASGGAPDRFEPVVDVTADEGGEVETERDREARIDEMERALESFGRRRTPDYGRRGRRR
jgi:hypothetical protein